MPYYSNRQALDKLREPKPQNLREVPDYLSRLIRNFFRRLFYIFRLVWETRPWILFVMLFMSLYNGVSPVISALIRAELLNRLAEAYVGRATLESVAGLLVLQFGYIFFNRLVGDVNSIFSRISGELVTNHIKLKIMHKSEEIDLASFDMPEFYEKLENANREAGSRPIQILSSTFSVISTFISLISFVSILWALSPFVPFVMILFALPSAVVNFVYRGRNYAYFRSRSKDRRQMNYFSGLITNKDMVKELRLFGLSDLFIDKYSEVFDRYFAGQKKLVVREGAWHIAISVLNCTVNCVFFLYVAREVSRGNIMIGNYSLYTGALNSISSGVSSLIRMTSEIYEGTLFIDNMIAFMSEEKHIVPLLQAPLSRPLVPERHIAHTFEFEHVSFRYPGTERDVIKDVNLTIRAGETVVLVGLNGAGKTTLIKLLTRLYDPTEGRILLDGHDLREYDVEELYRIFGIIFQDFGRYAVTAEENILYGNIRRDYDRKNVTDAAKESDADGFLSALPDGYDTPLMRHFEDNGVELSGGQWQKLAIARAFYSDADVLILDEPTAALDALAEQEIYSEFDRLRRDKTTLFVSHRLSSAKMASKIVVLQYGAIVEEGTHAELMALGGHYYTLFTTQASRYVEEEEAGDDAVDRGGRGQSGKKSLNREQNMKFYHSPQNP